MAADDSSTLLEACEVAKRCNAAPEEGAAELSDSEGPPGAVLCLQMRNSCTTIAKNASVLPCNVVMLSWCRDIGFAYEP